MQRVCRVCEKKPSRKNSQMCHSCARDQCAGKPCGVCGELKNNRGLCLRCQSKQNRRSKYKLTREQLDQLILEHRDRCAICGVPSRECHQALGVDHNHETSQVRGLLCHNCNIMVGCSKESKEILRRAIDYLEHYERVAKEK